MLQSVDSQKEAAAKFNETYEFEDALFLAVDKLQALCTAQSQLDNGESPLSANTRAHFSLVIEDQVKEIRRMLVAHFG